MIGLNLIKYNNKLFQIFMDENKNRIILEIKKNNNYYCYLYPEFNDLVNITKQYYMINSIVNNDNIKMSKKLFIKFAQKAIIGGIVISIVLCIPKVICNNDLQLFQNAHTSISQILPKKINSHQELNKEFNTALITKEDIHKAIDQNQNLNNFSKIIHDFVDDVHLENPKQNWWIFYHNIKKMNIDYGPDYVNADGTFDPQTANILIINTPDEEKLKTVLRHELMHALSLIDTKIDNKKVEILFYNNFSGYGRSVMELLTSNFNELTNDMGDPSYKPYKKIFEPLINKIGVKEFNNHLINGDINSFENMCKPYFENPYEYITHMDAVFFSENGGDVRTKRITDKEFLIKFRNMTLDFFVKLQYEQLKSGNITYNFYIDNRVDYINSLNSLINSSSNEEFSIADSYTYLNKLENKIFDKETLTKLEEAYNTKNNLMVSFFYSNKTNKFRGLRIDYIDSKGISKEHYSDSNTNNINDFCFVVENKNNDFKLRLINKNNPDFSNIDLLTYTIIDNNSDIVLEVSVLDYINNFPKEILLGENWKQDSYFTTINSNFFNVNDIMEFENSINHTK